GMGGPWKDTAVQANTSSDPYLMTGYNNKSVELSHNLQEDVVFAIEVDFLADRSWHVYKSISVPAGKTIVHKFPDGFSAHWVRLKTNKSCTATAWFIYNEDMWITGNREFVHTTEIEIKTGAEITPDEIRYTLDGSEPNATSEVYTVPFVLDHSATVKAIALVASIVVASATASFEKIILPPPIINPSGGKYIISKTVTIEPPAAVSNAEIRYTSDGSEPSSDSLLYTDSFVLTESTVVRAKTYLNDIGSSDTATELIFILPEVNISNLPQALGAATGLLSMDSLRCSDQYNFNELPSELLGFNYVSINRGDGMQPAPAYSVTVDMPVTAYLLLQDRGDPTIPADWQQAGITSRWLSDYTDTIYWNNYPAGTVDIPGHDGIDYAGWYGVPCMAVVVTHGPPLFRADPLCKSAAFED
ncbi:MAG: chitobiase/beta-hexosaminidase C-terminal domain-containing protein, partial [Sedimentisphaerales bacterium]|nr:chitobiase/beta-hexosaminidase C-terminal domain-containing protein [Sedimentisphaerales bacterium]